MKAYEAQTEIDYLKELLTKKDQENSEMKLKILRLESMSYPGKGSSQLASARSDHIMTSSNKETHSYRCPYTENNRFQTFIDELLKLDLPSNQLKRNILDYVRVMETYYADKIREFQKKLKNVQTDEKNKKAKMGKA